MSISVKKFGVLPSGEEISLYCIENEKKAYIEVMDFGAILRVAKMPDQDQNLRDVVLGYDTLEQYLDNGCFFGATVGRSGNRIEGSKFSINGEVYHLTPNEKENNLHSGPNGFEKKVWEAHMCQETNTVTFSRVSPDGENGFPGEFQISVSYTLTEKNEIDIHYEGVSSKDTIANMTNHSYFNLSGHDSGSIYHTKLQILADRFTPVGSNGESIPTGEEAPVENTPMDFSKAKEMGQDIEQSYEQLILGNGYDHNYVLRDYVPGKVRTIAYAENDASGITMEVESDTPCVQLYTANFVDGEKGKEGAVYNRREAFCLETQFAPNSINQPNFVSPVLKAQEKYDSRTVYRFGVK